MFASPVETDIAPSGSLLGLLQRGRGDGALHALAAPRAEALAALEQCVLRDPRRDWRMEHRSLYYARLHRDLDAGLEAVEDHLFHPDDTRDSDGTDPEEVEEERTGLALSVLGHLASYKNTEALRLLRRYAATGANWRWALDELAVRDSDEALRALGPQVLERFPRTPDGDAALAAALRDAFEPRPWRLWAEDGQRPGQRARLERARQEGSFDRWQRQLRPARPQPGWSVDSVLDWAVEGYEREPRQWREAPAARCLGAVAGPADRNRLLSAAAGGHPAARAAALRHLAERADDAVVGLIGTAAGDPDPDVSRAAVTAFSRMRHDPRALAAARQWAGRADDLGFAAAAMLAGLGDATDAPRVLAALRRAVRTLGAQAPQLLPLTEGVGRLTVAAAAPVLRYVYRETASSQLRGQAARSLASVDPDFPSGLAVECLWDCEESTREVAARFAATGDERVVERLRRLAADPAERDGVQTAVRGRLAGPAGR
ncbi:HEAT repeat domain-containing protein [Streptomyces sodiiphilus]